MEQAVKYDLQFGEVKVKLRLSVDESGSLHAYREGRGVLYLVQGWKLSTVEEASTVFPDKVWVVV